MNLAQRVRLLVVLAASLPACEKFALDTDVEAVDATVLALQDRMDAVEVQLGNLDTRATDAETRLTSAEARLASVESRLGTTESDVTELSERTDDLESLAGDHTAEISALATGTSANQVAIGTLELEVDTLEQDLAAVETDLVDLQSGLEEATTGVVFLAEVDSCVEIGEAESGSFSDPVGANVVVGSPDIGTGDVFRFGFDTTTTVPGLYAASLSGTWATSMNTDALTDELLLACDAGVTIREARTRTSLAVAGTSNVQVNIPFTLTTWLEVASPGPITCVLERRVMDVADNGVDVLFHSVCGPTTTKLEYVSPM